MSSQWEQECFVCGTVASHKCADCEDFYYCDSECADIDILAHAMDCGSPFSRSLWWRVVRVQINLHIRYLTVTMQNGADTLVSDKAADMLFQHICKWQGMFRDKTKKMTIGKLIEEHDKGLKQYTDAMVASFGYQNNVTRASVDRIMANLALIIAFFTGHSTDKKQETTEADYQMAFNDHVIAMTMYVQNYTSKAPEKGETKAQEAYTQGRALSDTLSGNSYRNSSFMSQVGCHSGGKRAKTIMDIITKSYKFDTLEDSVRKTGLVDTLSSIGPYTIFAPYDPAWSKAPDDVVGALMRDEDKLRSTLLYHVVKGVYQARDLIETGSGTVETLNGARIGFELRDGKILLDGHARVRKTDKIASNGVIHIIDNLLLPPQ